MQIVLSKVAEDPRCLYKHPTDQITLTAQIKDASSIMQPTFYIKYDADLIEQHYNYAQAWGRYYFIADMQIDIGGTIYIKCAEDVLYTYADQIVQCQIVAERSKNAFNAFIQDNEAFLSIHAAAVYHDRHGYRMPGYYLHVYSRIGGGDICG